MGPREFVPLSTRLRQFPAGESAGQKRKWRHSPNSSSYDGPVLSIQKSRIGFPQPLPNLPVKPTLAMAGEQQLAAWNSCQEATVEIISEEGLEFDEVGHLLEQRTERETPFADSDDISEEQHRRVLGKEWS